ncbi:glycosyltransferase family 2 protein [Yoonia sp. BS5-3]|uniref:Glycosyltransferase family 2 protein n=1 Tax=Yoonia phaeophyticola TaxID=3137369 RepID=A0ABZ2V593_9RHOB
MTELTILMPCLNEAETLETCIVKAMDYLKRSDVDGEVLIADNGSTDGSQDIAKRLGARVVDVPVKGYGAALGAGIAAAKGKFVIMGDSDDSYDFSNLDPFVEELRKGADLVMGNRFRGGIEKDAMPPLHRYLGNPVLSAVGRVFYRTPVGDFHCGLRGFSREAILGLHLNTPGMEFASEMVIRATLFGLDIREVPTTLKPDGRSRPPHLRSWRDGWLHLKLLLTFAPYWLFYYPGLIMFWTGLISFCALMMGPVVIGGVTFDVGTMILSSALLLTGFQMVCFYALSRIFAVRFNLLPTSDRFERLRKKITVDNACIAGGILLFIAFIATLSGIFSWGATGFGDMDASSIVRAASMAVVSASLGLQFITTGFLSSMLQQQIRPDPS